MRISHLDGLRGVAILLVFFYHAFARWGEIMPYGDQFSSWPIFRFGNFGVQLFFLVSGFVIYMTLERSDSILHFTKKRWLRLFPAMLICSLFVFSTAPFYFERPAGQPSWVDLLPGLTLIEPYYLSGLTGLSFSPLESAFWSIYVEAKFYLLACLIYFFVSKNQLPWFIGATFISWVILIKVPIISDLTWLEPIRWRLPFTSIEHFGWFASGCFCFQYAATNNKTRLWYAIGFALVSVFVSSKNELGSIVTLAIIVVLFVSSLRSVHLQRLLSNSVLIFFGFVSYPLYLIHENMMVASTIKIHQAFPAIPSYLIPVFALSFLTLFAYFTAKFLEPRLRGLLGSSGSFFSRRSR